jgi:catechol 2,3-dioxygenase
MDFLRDVLGFRSSDIVEFPNGDPMASWMHVGDCRHDVAAFVGGPGETLDLLAWTMSSTDHIKSALDRIGGDAIGRRGLAARLAGHPGSSRCRA